MAERLTETASYRFRTTAGDELSDHDTIMGYEFFLGRNPETASVIAEHRSKGFPKMMVTFMTSPEFAEKVLTPVRSGGPVRRGDYRRRPSEEQTEWLRDFVEFDEEQEKALNTARDWTEYFRALCEIGGFDLGQGGASSLAAEPRPEASDPGSEVERIVSRLRLIHAMLTEVEESVRALGGGAV
jgi:hypothetical protein